MNDKEQGVFSIPSKLLVSKALLLVTISSVYATTTPGSAIPKLISRKFYIRYPKGSIIVVFIESFSSPSVYITSLTTAIVADYMLEMT